MQVHQISIQYRPLDDRILLRLNFREGGEEKAWLTRRLCLKLWPHLAESVSEFVAKLQAAQGTSASSVALADTSTKQLLADLRRSASNEKANFSMPYESQPESSTQPLLAHTVNIYSQPAKAVFSIEVLDKPEDATTPQRRLKWSMNESTLHASMKLLEDAIHASGWDIPATAGAAAAAPTSNADSLHGLERPKYLN